MNKPTKPLPFDVVPGYKFMGSKVIRSKSSSGEFNVATVLFSGKGNADIDANYIVEASNNYPECIEFLERLESETRNKEVSDKIREFLIKLNIWERTPKNQLKLGLPITSAFPVGEHS